MSDGRIKYTFEAEDRISDVTNHVKGSFASLKSGVASTFAAFRSGGFAGAAAHLRELKLNGLAATGVMKIFAIVTNPVALGLMAVRLAAKSLSRAISGLKSTIAENVAFQKHTFDLKVLEGSYRAARQAMLQLTEGKFAVDHVFGTDSVVKAYRDLHTYTNGALASAYAVNVLGNRAAHTGNSIEAMSDIVGRAWQSIVSGEGLGRVGMQLTQQLRIDRSVVRELERMKESGASAGEVWHRLWQEIEKTNDAIRNSEGSMDRLNKTIADSKGTIANAWGSVLRPIAQGVRFVQSELLAGMADLHTWVFRMRPGDEAAPDMAGEADAQAAVEREAMWEDARRRQAERRETARIEAATIAQLQADQEQAQRNGELARWEQITIALEKKRAESAANRQAAERTAAMEYEQALSALEKRKDDLALTAMTPEQRAEEYDRRAEEAERRAERAARFDDDEAQAASLAARLEAINLREMAKGEREGLQREADRLAEADDRKRESEQREADRIADQLARRKDDQLLAGMDPEKRAAELERRAAEAERRAGELRAGREDADLTPGELRDALKLDLEALDLRQRAEGARDESARDKAARDREEESLRESLQRNKQQLEDLTRPVREAMGVEDRMQWMADVRAGRTPDEEIAENTRQIANILQAIRKDGGLE